MPQKVITIFGTSKTKPDQPLYQQVVELGAGLAEAGFAIANGGYGGTMEAAAKGAAAKNGKIIGVTCSAFKRSAANEFVSEEIRTASLTERIGKLIELGDGYIVLQGGTGTLLELAEVWELKNKHFMSDAKPVILLGDFWRPLLKLIAVDDPDSGNYLTIAENAEQTVKYLSERLGEKNVC